MNNIFCSECGKFITGEPIVIQAKRGKRLARAIVCSVTCAQDMLRRVFSREYAPEETLV